MALESATYINQLAPANPVATDPIRQADDHLRLIKAVLQNTFPQITGAVTATQAELNKLDGVTVTTTEINHLSGVTSAIQTQLNTLSTNKLNAADYTAADVKTKLLTVDGAGSEVDADLLDGQQGSFYQNAANLNAGTLPSARLGFALQAEAEAGVDATKVMNPLRVKQAITAQAKTAIGRFTSAAQTITSGAQRILPHGLGARPGIVMLRLKKIGSAGDDGYTIGDEIIVTENSSNSTGNRYTSILVDATNITLRFASVSAVFSAARKDTGSSTNLQNADWELYVEALL